MPKNRIRAGIALATITVAIGGGAPLRGSNGSPGANRAGARAIEGVWEPVVTIRDCQTNAVLFTFDSVDSYIQGGSYIGQGAPPPAVTGYGTWRHVAGRRFSAVFQFFTYAGDGSLTGRLKVSANILLSADGQSFTARDTTVITDLNGNPVAEICGTRTATRLH